MNKEKTYYVYKHTNKCNQKSYIGMTKLSPSTRWKKDGKGYQEQKKFYSDILAFGWDNFTHEIIATELTENEARALEKEMIKKYNSIQEGYNSINKLINGTEKSPYYERKTPEKKVYCVELNRIFDSASEAERQTGTDNSSIRKACLGIRKSAGKHPITNEKLHWIYERNMEDTNNENI